MKTEQANEINKRIESIEKELTLLKNAVNDRPWFLGKWCLSKINSVYFISGCNGKRVVGYGVDRYRAWFGPQTLCDESMIQTLAHPEYVKEIILIEARSRGFKEDTECLIELDMYPTKSPTLPPLTSVKGKFEWDLDKNILTLGDRTIFNDGRWAKRIDNKKEEEKIMIGAHEVIFMGNKEKGDMLYTRIEGIDYLKPFWEGAKAVVSVAGPIRICSTEELLFENTIDKILSRL